MAFVIPSCTKESQCIKTQGEKRRQAFFKVCEYCRYIISDNEHLKVLKAKITFIGFSKMDMSDMRLPLSWLQTTQPLLLPMLSKTSALMPLDLAFGNTYSELHRASARGVRLQIPEILGRTAAPS